MAKNNKENIVKFLLIGIPIIAIIAAIGYSVISKRSGWTSEKDKDENPYEYNIEELKKVDPKLVKYKEVDKVPITLKSPSAIAIHNDNIYVAGVNLGGFVIFQINEKKSVEFRFPGPVNSMALSDKGNIGLCLNNKIIFMDKTGNKIFIVENLPKKALLTSIAVEGDYIYVADAGRRVILQYDKNGNLKSEMGKTNKSEEIQGFIVPSANFDIIPGGDGSVWAVNPGRLQIENFTSDGRLRSSWKSSILGIKGFSGCCNPAHIALLPNGDFVTAEKNIVRVKVYDATGKFKCVVATPQQFADNAKILDIATDSEGKIFVLDSKTPGIRVFVKKDK